MKLKNLFFIIPAILSLIAGLYGALLRLGFALPDLFFYYSRDHGALIICGFLGTLISLERAAALNTLWTYGAPFLAGLSSILLLTNSSPFLFKPSFILTSIFLACLYGKILLQNFDRSSVIMAVGAVNWVTGNTLWIIGFSVKDIILWWISFLIFTIAGERIELSRLLYISEVSKFILLIVFISLYLSTTFLIYFKTFSLRLYGICIILLSLWLFKNDIARKALKQKNLMRFISLTLIFGFFWLGIGGLILLVRGYGYYYEYDAFIHAILLGFVFSMIFAHAPIIIPSLFSVSIEYSKIFYAPVILLNSSLLVRVIADMLISFEVRKWSGLVNIIAILFYFIILMKSKKRKSK